MSIFQWDSDWEDCVGFDKKTGVLGVSEDGSSTREIVLPKRVAINLASALLQYATAKRPE